MTAILESIHSFENKFDHCSEQFMFHHPRLSFAAAFLVLPLFIPMAVAACTAAVVLPMSLLFGWL